MDALPIATFARFDCADGRQRAVPWEKLLAQLTRHQEFGQSTKAGLWSPTRYRDGEVGIRRANNNVAALSCVVLDIDDGTPMDALTEGPLSEFEWAGHSTFRHTWEVPRFRIVLPMTREVLAADWEAFYSVVVTLLSRGHSDVKTKDVSRAYYWPACPPGGPRWSQHHAGRWLDPGEFAEDVFAWTEARRAVQRRPLKVPLADAAGRDRLLVDLIDRYIRDACQGRRNDRGYHLACQLRDNGLPLGDAERLMEQFAERVPQGDKPFTAREAVAIARSVYRRAPREPLAARESLQSGNLEQHGHNRQRELPELRREVPSANPRSPEILLSEVCEGENSSSVGAVSGEGDTPDHGDSGGAVGTAGERGSDGEGLSCISGSLPVVSMRPDRVEEWRNSLEGAGEDSLRDQRATVLPESGHGSRHFGGSDAGSDRVHSGDRPDDSMSIEAYRADALMLEDLPETKWVVPELLTSGVTLFGGSPKVGKSWLCLALAVAVAAGGVALGTERVEAGVCLYLALEDNRRRIRRRLERMLAGSSAPAALHLSHRCARLDMGGLSALRAWLDAHPETRLVIVDTLARVRPLTRATGSVYEQDYAAVSPLVDLASQRDIAVLVVHHTRKMGAEDKQDMLSGSAGLTGAVDASWILVREAQGPTLYARGRDIEETELALEWCRETCTWSIAGSAEERRRSDLKNSVLRLLQSAREALRADQIAYRIGKKHETPAVRQVLALLATEGKAMNQSDGRWVALG